MRTKSFQGLLILTAALLLGAAAAGPARAEPLADCKRMTRQIDHFEGVLELAEERDDELWEDATRDHIKRLEYKRGRVCPQYAEEILKRERTKWMAHETARFLKHAGKLAMRYFSFGTYGVP